MNKKIKSMILCAMFSSLIAVGAFIRIPVPPVPITMQTFFVILSGLTLGAKGGAVSTFVYMLLGLAGLPVFSDGGGIAYILNPKFGYIIGFILGAYVTGRIIKKSLKLSFQRLMIASVMGILMIYMVGIIYFSIISNFYLNIQTDIKIILFSCFLIFLPADIAICILSSVISRRLIPILNKL